MTAVKECLKKDAMTDKPVLVSMDDESLAKNPDPSVKPVEIPDCSWKTADEVLRSRKCV